MTPDHFGTSCAKWLGVCVAGYYIGHHTAVMRTIDRYGHVIVPFVLIGLGVYIIIESR